MTQQPDSKPTFKLLPTTPWDQFLAKSPPGTEVTVTGFYLPSVGGRWFKLATPELNLHCPNGHCDRDQFFDCVASEGGQPQLEQPFDVVLIYQCRNCQMYQKKIAIAVLAESKVQAKATKYGESPPFGPVVPPRVLELIGHQENVDLFMKGRRAESHGLGIGAFTYYRRLVENLRDRLFDRVIEVAKRGQADDKRIESLEAAKANYQFTQSVKGIKPYIPESLLIDGQSPLTLLYKPLSKGVHALTDAECLKWAQDIRVVLTDFSGKLAEALKQDADVAAAVASLLGPPPSAEAGEES